MRSPINNKNAKALPKDLPKGKPKAESPLKKAVQDMAKQKENIFTLQRTGENEVFSDSETLDPNHNQAIVIEIFDKKGTN